MRDTIANATAPNVSSSASSPDWHHSHIHDRLLQKQRASRNTRHFCCHSLTLSKLVQSQPASTERKPAEQQHQGKKKHAFFSSSFFKYMLTTAFAYQQIAYNQNQAVLCSMATRTLHPTCAKQWDTQATPRGQFNTHVNQAWISEIPSLKPINID